MAATTEAPRLSVVIPLYNKQGQIARTLESVLAQTVRDIEVVVVDDGSTDGGPAVAAACSDPRVRLHRQANAGVSAARNQGVALARCPLVAFVDADDAWYPDHLERLWSLRLAYPAAVAWAANYEIVEAGGRRTPGVRPETGPPLLLTPENFYRIALRSSPVCSSAVMVDKGALLAAGGFPVGVRLGEDLDTWIRLLFRGPIAFDPRPGACYHADGDDRALVRHAPPARYVFFDTPAKPGAAPIRRRSRPPRTWRSSTTSSASRTPIIRSSGATRPPAAPRSRPAGLRPSPPSAEPVRRRRAPAGG